MGMIDSVSWLAPLLLAIVFMLAPSLLRRQSRDDGYQFNRASWRSLPPVDCPLLIRVGADVVRVKRTSHIERVDGEMEYLADDGRTFTGRYDWTYP